MWRSRHPIIRSPGASAPWTAIVSPARNCWCASRARGSRVVFEKFLKGLHLTQPSPLIEFGSNETIKQAVMAGLGLALLSAHTIELEIETGRLAILNIKDLPIVREWNLVHRLDKGLGPAASAFWRYALKDGQGHLPRISGL
jgi:DNA-binding transcriptional LysR family regulator